MSSGGQVKTTEMQGQMENLLVSQCNVALQYGKLGILCSSIWGLNWTITGHTMIYKNVYYNCLVDTCNSTCDTFWY